MQESKMIIVKKNLLILKKVHRTAIIALIIICDIDVDMEYEKMWAYVFWIPYVKVISRKLTNETIHEKKRDKFEHT